MDRILLGWKRWLIPIPWELFIRIAPAESRKTKRRLGGLNDEQRRIHHYVVRELPKLGRPMPPEQIAEALGLGLPAVVSVLDELERRLIFLFRPGGREVVWAYPVTAEPTPHRMEFSSGERIWAA